MTGQWDGWDESEAWDQHDWSEYPEWTEGETKDKQKQVGTNGTDYFGGVESLCLLEAVAARASLRTKICFRRARTRSNLALPAATIGKPICLRIGLLPYPNSDVDKK